MVTGQLDERAIFKVAIQIPVPDARAEYLSQVCGDDVSLFDRLTALLHAHDERPEFLESPPPGLESAVVASDSPDISGTRIGPYKLLQQIGEGGFGIVYMAEQIEPVRRKVAVKIIKPGMDSKEVIARFEAERQATALMDHPNIARILDAGSTETGRPYFVMELVKGVPITKYCDTNKLTTRERLRLFSIVCRAVQHAHQKGVIHRDLKPTNVLVTLHDGEPVPKIIDFGVAKALSSQLTDKTMFTRYGQVIGTPQYMSPEQAEMSGLDVDTRSDVYSLGVLLYELLTGRPPFESKQLHEAGIDEMRRVIREKEPVMPSCMIRTLDADMATTIATHRKTKPAALLRVFQGELDWIVMKALEKDRNRRYETANGLAEDVDRYLRDDVVLASPPSTTYRLWKSIKRHRIASVSIATVTLSLLLGLVVSLIAISEVNVARENAENLREIAEQEKKKTETSAQIALEQRREAERMSAQASREARNANQMLDLVLGILSKARINPDTAQPYTVEEALRDLASELEADTTLPSKSVAQLYLALGKTLYSGPEPDRAIRHFKNTCALCASELGMDSLLASQSLRYLGILENSSEKLSQAAEIERKIGEKQELARTLTLLGVQRHCLEELEEAERYLTEACTLSQLSDPNILLEEIPFLPMANLLRERARTKEADEFQARAITAAKSLFGTDPLQWWLLAETYRTTHQHRAYKHAVLVCEDLKGLVGTGSELLRLARGFRALAEYDRADHYASDFNKRVGETNPWTLAGQARIYMDLHDFATAERLLRQACAVAEQKRPDDQLANIECRLELAIALKNLGKTDQAKEEEGVALFTRVAEDIQRSIDEGIIVYQRVHDGEFSRGDHGQTDKINMYAARLRSSQEVTISEIQHALGIADRELEELPPGETFVMGLAHMIHGDDERVFSVSLHERISALC